MKYFMNFNDSGTLVNYNVRVLMFRLRALLIYTK